MKGEPEELHGEGIMTEKHGATTEWMEAKGECLASLNEGDTVYVLDRDHASTNTSAEYEVTTVPTMEYDFHTPDIKIVEKGTLGPAITLLPGKVSTDAKR